MSRVAFLLFLLFLSLAIQAQTTPEWFGHYGGIGNDDAQASCFDPQGNYYLAGSFKGSFTAGTYTLTSTSHQAFFIIKFSPTGVVLWAIRNSTVVTSTRTVTVSGIAVDATQHVYLAGSYSEAIKFGVVAHTSLGYEDMFLARFDPAGTYLWSLSLGGTGSDIATGISMSPEGGAILLGQYGSVIATPLGSISHQGVSDILIAKFNSNGILAAYGNWGGSSDDQATSILAIASGGYVITGSYTGSITFGAQVLASAGREAYLCKLSEDFAPQWAIGTTGSGEQEGTAVAISDTDIIWLGKYAAAFTLGGFALPNSGASLFYAKLSSNGILQNALHLGSCTSGATSLRSAVVNNRAAILAVGTLSGSFFYPGGNLSSAGSIDALSMKVDANGAVSWVQAFGGASFDNSAAISKGGNGKYLICGHFSPNAVFGTISPPNAGLKDIFGYIFSDASADTPAIPANLSLQISGPNLVLSWDAVSTAENGDPLPISGYHIYYSSSPEAQSYQFLSSTSSTSCSFPINEFIPDLRFFRVSAYINP